MSGLVDASPLPAADLLPVGPHANLAYRLVRMVGVPVLRLCFRFDVQGRENVPRARSGNYIVIANHLNWLDEFALLCLFPVPPTAGKEPAPLTDVAFATVKSMLPAYSDPGGRKLLRGWLTHLF